MSFTDRTAAGQALVAPVQALGLQNPLVLALPRGGIPVALEVARALRAPMDLLIVRKIGAPWNREMALAAVVEGDPPQTVTDAALAGASGADADWIAGQAAREQGEIARRRRVYCQGRPPADVRGRAVIVVDDGIATGTTVRAALQGLRRQQPASLTLAVPVAPPDTVRALQPLVDHLVCLRQPEGFEAVGQFYRHFDQVEDPQVMALLDAARREGLMPGSVSGR